MAKKKDHADSFVAYAIPELRSWAPGCELDEDDIAFLNEVADVLEERCQK